MEEIAAVGEDPAHDLGSSFAHNQFVSGDESDNSVGILLDELDELGIDHDGMSVETCEFNHHCLPFMDAIGEERTNLKAGSGRARLGGVAEKSICKQLKVGKARPIAVVRKQRPPRKERQSGRLRSEARRRISMSLSILNNVTAMSAENQLNITNTSLQNTLLQLSSGSKLNSGADDAAGLSIANGLTANITALTQSATNASNAQGRLQVADGALSQVTSLLNRAVTLATESASDTVSDGSQRAALDNEFSSIKSEIDSIGANTTFNGSSVFAGGSTNYGQVALTGTGLGLTTAITSGKGEVDISVTGGTTYKFNASGADTTVGSLIDDINGSGDGLVASLNSSGSLVVTDTQNRATDAATELAVGRTTLQAGTDSAAETGANTTDSSKFNVYLSDGTTAGSSTISTTLGALSSSNMNGVGLGSNDLLSSTDAQSALTAINNAIAQVAALRGNLGASMNRLTAAGNVINTQVTNLTSAEDNVSSADISQQVTNMSRDQVLTQTGISALSQANQMQQALLKLLQ